MTFFEFAAKYPCMTLSLAAIAAFALVGFSLFLPPFVSVRRAPKVDKPEKPETPGEAKEAR